MKSLLITLLVFGAVSLEAKAQVARGVDRAKKSKKLSKSEVAPLKASYKGDLAQVEALLKQPKINVNATNASWNFNTSLIIAAGQGNIPVMKLLFNRGANVHALNKDGNTPFILAASYGEVKAMKLLLAKGANIHAKNKFGSTALIMAAAYGHIKAMEFLLKNGAKINATTTNGETACIEAAGKGQLEAMKYLVSQGANVNAESKYGVNVVWHLALGVSSKPTAQQIDAMKFLVSQGANVNAVNKYGRTALMLFAHSGLVNPIKFLVSTGGAKIDVKNKYGQTALMFAAAGGNVPAIKYLLSKGANIHAKSKEYDSALDYAKMYKHPKAVQVLEAAMKKAGTSKTAGHRALGRVKK